ncbi:MAG: hypothetical protein ACP6IY_18945 [Promethearchaeia archaeon]
MKLSLIFLIGIIFLLVIIPNVNAYYEPLEKYTISCYQGFFKGVGFNEKTNEFYIICNGENGLDKLRVYDSDFNLKTSCIPDFSGASDSFSGLTISNNSLFVLDWIGGANFYTIKTNSTCADLGSHSVPENYLWGLSNYTNDEKTFWTIQRNYGSNAKAIKFNHSQIIQTINLEFSDDASYSTNDRYGISLSQGYLYVLNGYYSGTIYIYNESTGELLKTTSLHNLYGTGDVQRFLINEDNTIGYLFFHSTTDNVYKINVSDLWIGDSIVTAIYPQENEQLESNEFILQANLNAIHNGTLYFYIDGKIVDSQNVNDAPSNKIYYGESGIIENGNHTWYANFTDENNNSWVSETVKFTVNHGITQIIAERTKEAFGFETNEMGLNFFAFFLALILAVLGAGSLKSAEFGIIILISSLVIFSIIGWLPAWVGLTIFLIGAIIFATMGIKIVTPK